jgi:hypothetical protein
MKLTRRLFLKRSALTGGALASASAIPPALAQLAAAPASEVVTFFDGQLWLDASGLSRPYRAPDGARGAASLAQFADADLYALYGRI